jgi:hypothetical protein
VAQSAFLLYSLFSVDIFTTRVEQLVTRDPPKGLSTAMRGLLLALMGANLIAAAGAEALSGLAIRGAEAARDALAARRRACGGGGAFGLGGGRDAAAAHALLMPGGLPAVVRGNSANLSPVAGAGGPGLPGLGAGLGAGEEGGIPGVHVPRMQRPAGAELL